MIDHALINVLAGKGGSGAVAFRREKYVPFGGPSGGDGGEGGSVFIKANSQRATLEEFTAGKIYKAGDGQNGKNKNKTGLSGKDLEIRVPVGTVVKWKHTDTGDDGFIDLDKEGDSLLVAQGGQGGKGNAHFATSTNRAPRLAESGEKGENLEIVLDLKLLADVGLVGQPNAGKSSFLARTTGAFSHPTEINLTISKSFIPMYKYTKVFKEILIRIEFYHRYKCINYKSSRFNQSRKRSGGISGGLRLYPFGRRPG